MKLILLLSYPFRLALAEQRAPVRRGITTSPSGGVRMVVTVKRGQGGKKGVRGQGSGVRKGVGSGEERGQGGKSQARDLILYCPAISVTG